MSEHQPPPPAQHDGERPLPRRPLLPWLVLLGVAASLAVSFSWGLPALTARRPTLSGAPPIWSFLAPAAAAAAAALFVFGRRRRALRSGRPEKLARLPHEMTAVFSLVALLGVGIGLLVEKHPLTELHDRVVLFCAPALVLAHALFLLFMVHGLLMAEISGLLRGAGASPRRKDPAAASRRPVPAGGLVIRGAIPLIAISLTMVALTLISVHAYSQAVSEQESLEDAHLADLLQIARAQIKSLPPELVRPFLAAYPLSSLGTPILVGPDARVAVPITDFPEGAAVTAGRGECLVAGRQLRCVSTSLKGGQQLLVIRPPRTAWSGALAGQLRFDVLLLVLWLMPVAGLLGWGIGLDTSRDFHRISRQLSAMSRENEPDLGRPIPVTTVDEVGELTSALGQLRLQLDGELEGYRKSLRQAQEADRITNRFLSDVSHEIRTPLTTVCGFAQMLAEGLAGDLSSSQRDDLRIIYNSGQQLLSLVNDVLDLSMIETGQMTLTLDSVDVVSLCREVVRGQMAAVKKKAANTGKSIELSIDAASDLPAVVADPLRLRQVLQNLVTNALKFTTEGGIVVRLAAAGPDRVSVQVADTGTGISATELPRIFDNYHQSGSISTRRQGSGLGLGICRRLVALHGGEISVESEIGIGSTFTVMLPVLGPRRDAAEEAE